jgi:ubiquinone biosynthesis monooxygenase Coq7
MSRKPETGTTAKGRKPAKRSRPKAGAGPRRRLPGDLSERALLERMIRVDQAGEFGAKQIYKGQLAVLRGTRSEAPIAEMAAQEDEHLARFNALLAQRRVRPTALTPVWRLAGYALGAGTALLGERAAMACTVAVEEVIEDHYRRQAEALDGREPDLKETIEEFRRDELAHRDIGLDHDAEDTPGYAVMRRGIKAGTRLAIWLSERI